MPIASFLSRNGLPDLFTRPPDRGVIRGELSLRRTVQALYSNLNATGAAS